MEKSSARPGIVSRKKRFLRTVLFLLVLLIVLLSLSVALLSVNMRPAMTALAIARIRSVAARAMNDAILESMGDETNYARLIQVHESSERVHMLQANTHKMNILAADCAEAAQERIAQMGDQGISIPIGTITGISFLAGKGPSLKVTFSPAGSVQSEFNSEFVSSGINQTLYRVNLLLTASVRLVMPGVSETISVRAEAAIAESIIVGDVPEVYTNVASEEDMLNLIPTETP